MEDVAAALGNTPTVCRKYYIHPILIESLTVGVLEGAIERTYELVFGRKPCADEIETMRRHATGNGLSHVCWVLLNSTEFIYVQ